MVRLLLTFVLMVVSAALSAQRINFRNYTMQDGLVANLVNSIYQDSSGFIWIATWQGLSKYDGNKFTNFNSGNGLSFDFTNALYEEERGRLYVALNNGTIELIENDRVVQRVYKREFAVNKFIKRKDGRLLICTDDDGLYSLEDDKEQCLLKEHLGPMQAFEELNDSMVVIGGEGPTLCVLDRDFNIISRLPDDPQTVHQLYRDSHQRVWACTGRGLMLIDPVQRKNKIMRFLPLPEQWKVPALSGLVTSILEDDAGIFWIGTSKGLVKIDQNGKSELYTIREGLLTNMITCLYADREKNIWVGTYQGVSKIVSKNDVRFLTGPNKVEDLRIQDIYPASRSAIYFCASDGVFQKINAEGVLTAISKPYHWDSPVLFDRQQPMLLRGTGKKLTLVTVDTVTDRISHSIIDPGRNFYFTARDKYGNLFFATDAGVYWRAAGSNTFLPYGAIPHRVTCLAFDRQGDLWAGTWYDGLYRIRQVVSNGEKHTETDNLSDLVKESSIRSLLLDRKGNMWVGTRYSGAVCITMNNNDQFSTRRYSQKQGLVSNFVFSMSEDSRGNIWIVSYMSGLDKLAPAGNGYRAFNFSRVSYNIPGDIYHFSPLQDNDFICATSSGILRFRDDETNDLPPPKVFITSLHAGKAQDSITITDTRQNLKLNYRQSFIQFEFAAPSFINEKEIMFSYRLLGSPDTAWSDPARRYSVFYASLKPGRYRFEVKALGWDGEWSMPAVYSFTIHPPWWQTWWFLIAILALITGLVSYLVKRRIDQVRHVAEMKQRMTETEMMALRAQMNPHFIFNCMNSIDALIQSNDKYHATMYLNKFAKLLRNILDSSKQNTVPLAKDLETLQLYIDLEQMRSEHAFHASVVADEILLQDDYRVPPLIIQPYVENAILHGLKNRPNDNGQLKVTVSKKWDHIQYLIEDNGVGRKALKNGTARHGQSYGMQMSYDRVKLFNDEEHASVVVTDLEEDGQPSGTKVQVLLKIR